MTTERVYKVLPFTTAQGEVPGHEIRAFLPIDRVEFERWDAVAQMTIAVVIPWQRWTEYMKRSWPNGGSACAVYLDDGTRLHVKAWSVSHYDNAAYLRAPMICRDEFMLTTYSKDPVLEVVGVREWIYSKRDAEATARYLIDPWERDNRAFHECMAQRAGE